MLGSIVPSSRFLIRQLLEPMHWGRARVLVEYGPGVGDITAELLRHMRPDAKLVAIEMNPDFVRHLNDHDQRPAPAGGAGSAADVDVILRRLGLARADYIISGIPFSTIAARGARQDPAQDRRRCWRPAARSCVYQFSERVLQDLQRVFGYVGRQVPAAERAARAPVHLPAQRGLGVAARACAHCGGAACSPRSSSSPK